MCGWFVLLFHILTLIAIITIPKRQSKTRFILLIVTSIMFIAAEVGCFNADMQHKVIDEKVVSNDVIVEQFQLEPMSNSLYRNAISSDSQGFVYGTLNSENKYQFLCMTADGTYKDIYMNANEVEFYELDPNEEYFPQIVRCIVESTTEVTIDESQLKYFKPFWRENKEPYTKTQCGSKTEGTLYKVYVPSGSIATIR